MTNKELTRRTKTDIEKKQICEWYEFEQHTRFGFDFNKTTNEDICNALMHADSDLKRLGATNFDYWTSTYGFQKEQRAYVQTYKGARIIDTRLVFQIEQASRRRSKTENYELTRKGDLYTIKPIDKLNGLELVYVTFLYKRLITHPTHNRMAKVVSGEIIEELIDNEINSYKKEKGINKVIRKKTCAEIDIWVPESYDMCTGTPVELHQGLCACVGTTYFEGNEFPQSLYFIIDKEKGDVVYIKTLPFGGIIHATRTDRTEVTSGPTIIDRRELKFAGTRSKLRPGQMRAQLV